MVLGLAKETIEKERGDFMEMSEAIPRNPNMP
jgi:hypothetical protein